MAEVNEVDVPEVCVEVGSAYTMMDIYNAIDEQTKDIVDADGTRIRPTAEELISATSAVQALVEANTNPSSRISITIKLKFKKWSLEITIGW